MEANVSELSERRLFSARSISCRETEDDEPLDALAKLVHKYTTDDFNPNSGNAVVELKASDDPSVVTIESGFDTIATHQKGHLMSISETSSDQLQPKTVTNLREIVEQCTAAVVTLRETIAANEKR